MATTVGLQNKSLEKQKSWMSYTMPPTTSSWEPRLSSRTPLFKLIQPHSSNGIFSTMVSNLARRKPRKARLKPKKLRKRRKASTFSPLLRADKIPELLTTKSLTNSPLVDCLLAYLQDQVKAEELTDTFLREKSLSSTLRKWKGRRSDISRWAISVLSKFLTLSNFFYSNLYMLINMYSLL